MKYRYIFTFMVFIITVIPYCFCYAVGEISEHLLYVSYIDYDNPNFNEENWIYKVQFENGEELIFKDNLRYVFLIINGKFENIPVEIENGNALISAKTFCNRLGANIKFEKEAAIIEGNNKKIIITEGCRTAIINGKILTMPVKAYSINGELCIPLRFVSEELGACVTYTKEILAPFNNPVIDIECREQQVDESEALSIAYDKANACFNCMLSSGKYLNNDINTMIEKKINNMSCIDETAGFWIIKGPYIFLVDKNTGDLFVKYGNGTKGHGSYREEITEVDIFDSDFFAKDYYLG